MARNPGVSLSAIVPASGRPVIEIRQTGVYSWTVDQVSTEYLTAPLGCSCGLYRNGSLITAMFATGGVADGNPPLILNSGDVATVEWKGATPGTTVKAWFTYDDGS